VTGGGGAVTVARVTQLKLDTFLPYRLSVVSNRVSAAIATAYDRLFALKIPEWRLIAVIAEGQAITQQAVGVATRMDKVTVSRAAQALAERGLIARQPNMGDRRSHLLTLTATGRALYDQVAPKALEMEAAIFEQLDPAERRTLAAMLELIEAAAAAVVPEADERS
jgi:DNA-binding MarR family transcriptional regulator